MASNNEPVKRFRIGAVTASVWKAENGYAVTLEKSYRDGKGDWQTTSSLWHQDVLCAISALQKAESYISQ